MELHLENMGAECNTPQEIIKSNLIVYQPISLIN